MLKQQSKIIVVAYKCTKDTLVFQGSSLIMSLLILSFRHLVESCFLQVSHILDDIVKPKYHNLWILVKYILVLSHRNADSERGFSINKRLIDLHGYNIQEESIEAVRFVKDYLIQTRIVGILQSVNERKDGNPTRKTCNEYFKSYRWQK